MDMTIPSTPKSKVVSKPSETIEEASKAPKRSGVNNDRSYNKKQPMKRLKPEYARSMSHPFEIPNEDFNDWPERLVVVRDMNNQDITGQSASFRTAVRQGILTRLLKQPSIVTLNKDPGTFALYFPTEGFELFLKAVRKMFRAITAEPGAEPPLRSTNSPYAGYLLEFATEKERANFDLNLVRENAETPNRKFPHGHQMFSADLKKYVEDRKEELEKFMTRFFDSNVIYSRVGEWTPEPAPTTGRLTRIPYRCRPSYPGSKALVGVATNDTAGSTSSLISSLSATPSKLQVNWSDDVIETVKGFTIQEVKDYIEMLGVGDLEKQKMLDVEMNGEVLTSITKATEFMKTCEMTLMEAFNVIKAMNTTTFEERSNDENDDNDI